MVRKHTSRLRAFLFEHPAAIILGTVVLAAIMLTIFGNLLLQERRAVTQQNVANATNLGLVMEHEVTRTFQLVDLSLQVVVDLALDPVVRALPRPYRQNMLFDRSTTAGKYLGSMLYVDANGDIVDDSFPGEPRRANFADRDWFLVHRNSNKEGLFMSAPLFSRINKGAHLVALSRRVNHPDGTFAGVAIASIRLDYFTSLMNGVKLGNGGTVALFKTDGTIYMHSSGNVALIGTTLRGTRNFERFKQTGEKEFFAQGAIDGAERLYVFRQFAEVPLILSIAPSKQEVFAAWERQSWYTGGFMLMLAAALIFLSWLLTGEFRRRLDIEAGLRQLSSTDSLTGLNNRRALDQYALQEWHRSRRSKEALSVLFVDIDHFKSFNDTYGHQTGDVTLIRVARAIAGCVLRPTDFAARYGGEEFMLVLPDTSRAGALHLAQTIHLAIDKLGITHSGSNHGRVTVSIGIATAETISHGQGPEHSLEALVELADQALYRAKEAGRNRSVGESLLTDEPKRRGMTQRSTT